MAKQSLTPEAPCPDAGSPGETHPTRSRTRDEHVASILPNRDRGNDEAVGKLGGKILHRMHPGIDLAREQGIFDLFQEESLATGEVEGSRESISRRPDRADLDRHAGVELAKPGLYPGGLHERQGASARPQPNEAPLSHRARGRRVDVRERPLLDQPA